MKKTKKTDLQIILPREISREVSLIQREKRKVKKAWTEEVVTIKMPFGLMEDANPLLFQIFPELIDIMLGRKKVDPNVKINELMGNGIISAFQNHMGPVKKLLAITLEKPLEWVEILEPSDGLGLLSDWVDLNKDMLSSSNGDNSNQDSDSDEDVIKKK